MSVATGTTNGRKNGTKTRVQREHGDREPAPLPAPVLKGATGEEVEQALEPTAEESAFVEQIAELWLPYEQRGLVIRHQIGRMLNQRFGPPTERQLRGQWVMSLVSKRLDISVSEMGRMRWFAHQFQSVDELNRQHPTVDSWTKFKELLPTLVKTEGKDKSTADDGTVRFVRMLTHSLKHLATTINKDATGLESKDRQKVLEGLRELAKVIEAKLYLRLTVTQRRQPPAKSTTAA